MEHFAGERAVELDLERRVDHPTVRLRAAYADYITAELLRFDFWLNMLTAQEFLRALGIGLQGSAPDHWFLERGQGSPVLDELSDLLDRRVVSPRPTRKMASQPHALSTRLAEAKHQLRNSRIEALLRRVAGSPESPKREDPNIYPLVELDVVAALLRPGEPGKNALRPTPQKPPPVCGARSWRSLRLPRQMYLFLNSSGGMRQRPIPSRACRNSACSTAPCREVFFAAALKKYCQEAPSRRIVSGATLPSGVMM